MIQKCILCLFLAAAPSIRAGNTQFQPGDAFFAGLLEKSGTGDLVSEDRLFLSYFHSDNLMRCGHQGAGWLEIQNLPDVFRELVANSASRPPSRYPGAWISRRAPGEQAILVLVYPRGYDINRFSFMLRYNESVAELPHGGGDHLQLNPDQRRGRDQAAEKRRLAYLARLARDAKGVPPLATTPPVPWRDSHETVVTITDPGELDIYLVSYRGTDNTSIFTRLAEAMPGIELERLRDGQLTRLQPLAGKWQESEGSKR